MTSERQILANRRNAQRSRGPRTPAARRRVGHNAFVHGLAVSVLKDRSIAREVERMAQALAGTQEQGALLAQAKAIIETELDLQRIARAKVGLLNAELLALKAAHSSAQPTPLDKKTAHQATPMPASTFEFTSDANVVGPAMINLLPQLTKLERYESRARSRHARAFRLFAAHKAVAFLRGTP